MRVCPWNSSKCPGFSFRQTFCMTKSNAHEQGILSFIVRMIGDVGLPDVLYQ